MFLLKRSKDFSIINILTKKYSISRKCHYEILNLSRNCSDKDIKKAFIRLSKEYHPDVNKDANAQAHFVRVVEAYNVLGKPGSRARYDSTREIHVNNYGPTPVYRPHTPYNFRSESYGPSQGARDKANDFKSRPYYGVQGVNKVPNYVIIMLCFGLAAVGLVLQIFVIRQSFNRQQTDADLKSRRNALALESIRAAAAEHGNEFQTQLILDKIASSANPNVATATLGQALASEKPK